MKKHILAILLALLTLLPLFAGCQEAQSEKPSETTDTQAPATTDELVTRDPYEDDVPKLDFKEWDFTIIAPLPSGASYFDREEMTEETINDAIYTRNRLIEDRLNILITSQSMGSSADMAATIKPLMVANEDIIGMLGVTFTQSAKPLITEGIVMPWNNMPYIDLDEMWWNKSVTETMAVLGNYYYITGDINWSTMAKTTAWYFNKDVAKNHQIPDLYQIVRDDKWTWDKASDLMKNLTIDNGDGIWNNQDTYAHIQYLHSLEGWIYGANYKTVLFKEDGVQMQFLTQKLKNIVDHVYNMLYVQKCSYMTADFDEIAEIFFDNRALFLTGTLQHGETFRAYDGDFGFLPNPKYDEKQKEYTTLTDQWGLVCGLPKTTLNFERTGAILEVMAAQSHKLIRPAYYDKTLMGKVKRDDESEEMLDIIFKGVIYDSGQCYITNLNVLPMRATVGKANNGLASWWRTNEKLLTNNYKELYDYVIANGKS